MRCLLSAEYKYNNFVLVFLVTATTLYGAPSSGRNYNSKFKFIFIRSSGITLINSDCGDAASDRMETIFSLGLFSINFNLNQPTLPSVFPCSFPEGRMRMLSTIKWWWLVMVSPSVLPQSLQWKVSHSNDNILSLCSKLDCSSYQISNNELEFLSKWQVFSGKIPSSSEICDSEFSKHNITFWWRNIS